MRELEEGWEEGPVLSAQRSNRFDPGFISTNTGGACLVRVKIPLNHPCKNSNVDAICHQCSGRLPIALFQSSTGGGPSHRGWGAAQLARLPTFPTLMKAFSSLRANSRFSWAESAVRASTLPHSSWCWMRSCFGVRRESRPEQGRGRFRGKSPFVK